MEKSCSSSELLGTGKWCVCQTANYISQLSFALLVISSNLQEMIEEIVVSGTELIKEGSLAFMIIQSSNANHILNKEMEA